MLSEEQLKLKVRLTAIEYVLAHHVAQTYHAWNLSADSINELHRGAINVLRDQTISKLPPEQSDMVADELLAAVQAILVQIRHNLGLGDIPTEPR